jgi:hypothetical protein
MTEEKAKAPTGLLAHVRKYAFRYFGLIGLAMGCVSKMDGLIKVSSWVSYVTHYYRHILLEGYAYLSRLIGLHIPPFVGDAVVMLLFYVSIMTYGMTHGKPVDVPLETQSQKLIFVLKRVPISVLTAVTCFIFMGASAEQTTRVAILFLPMSVLMYSTIALRLKVMRFQLEREHIRYLAAVWVLIAILAVLSQTRIFEFLAGSPPPPPSVATPNPFDIL